MNKEAKHGGASDQEIKRLAEKLPPLERKNCVGEKYGAIVADIGKRLAVLRENLGNEEWSSLLSSIGYTPRDAENFINVARFRKVRKDISEFFTLDLLSVPYCIAS